MPWLRRAMLGVVAVCPMPVRAQTAPVTPTQLVGTWEQMRTAAGSPTAAPQRVADSLAEAAVQRQPSIVTFRADSIWTATLPFPTGQADGDLRGRWHLVADTLWWGPERMGDAGCITLEENGRTLKFYRLRPAEEPDGSFSQTELTGDDESEPDIYKRLD